MLKVHPIASIFPQMSDVDLNDLAADISENGLHEPVWLFEGQILDGRNRYLACELAGVKCDTRMFKGSRVEAVAFVWSMNRQRRHLNSSQAAVAEAKRAKMVGEYAEELTKVRAEAAKWQKDAGRQGGKQGGRGHKKTLGEHVPQGFRDQRRTATQRAKAAGTNRKYLESAERLVEARPDLVTAVERGEKTLRQVAREIKSEARRKSMDAAIKMVHSADLAKVADVRHCSMQDLLAGQQNLDAIVTDPPYPAEFIPLYGELARRAKAALKPNGVLAVLCGQSYLPRILSDMAEHMPYRWAFAYLTPGGQAVQVWDRKINTFWKPVLVFGGAQEWAGDVVTSKPNDNDKDFHFWGQSVSGFLDLVKRITKPGDLVCDPFMGAGTTGVACLLTGRRFIGCDTEEKHVAVSRQRLALAHKQEVSA